MGTTKFDLVDSELNAAKSQTHWVTSDLTDVHQLATQLDEEKYTLQRQISDQAQEIESLNVEINSLKKEILKLTKQTEEEKSASEEQIEQIRKNADPERYKDRL